MNNTMTIQEAVKILNDSSKTPLEKVEAMKVIKNKLFKIGGNND